RALLRARAAGRAGRDAAHMGRSRARARRAPVPAPRCDRARVEVARRSDAAGADGASRFGSGVRSARRSDEELTAKAPRPPRRGRGWNSAQRRIPAAHLAKERAEAADRAWRAYPLLLSAPRLGALAPWRLFFLLIRPDELAFREHVALHRSFELGLGH